MDTLSHVITHVTVTQQIAGSLQPIGWVLIFTGWIAYWLKALNTARRLDTNSFWSVPLKDFCMANVFEFGFSLLACFILVLTDQVPASFMDSPMGKIAIFMLGYGSSSALNGLISLTKPAKTPDVQ